MRRRQMEEQLERDIREHIDAETRENLERGMPLAEARSAALRKFGNVARVQEETRAVWGWMWLEQALQDARHGLRMLRHNPAFTAVAIGTLALGIGMNTAVFSVVNAVLIQPLSYPDPDRLVWLANYNQRFKMEAVAGPDFFDWRQQAQSFEKMAAYGVQDMTLAAGGDADQVHVASVSTDFWQMTGARPQWGRVLGVEDRAAIVLTHALFERRFAGDPGVIGRTVTLNGQPVTVAGVLPKNFRFLLPVPPLPNVDPKDVDAYIPMSVTAASQVRGRNMAILLVAAKMKPRVPIGQARSELEGIQARIAHEYPGGFYDLVQLRVVPLQEQLVGNARPALLVLLAAVGFVLLIACGNLANLLLARASSRQKEMAIRAAVGAGRMRVLRQFLVEGAVLAVLGGASGLMLAGWTVRLLARLWPLAVPRLAEAGIDGRVLLFTLVVSLATGALFGFGPALSFAKGRPYRVLKEGGRTSTAGSAGARARGLLVAGELALAVVLLTGAGLMVKSFWRMNERPPGFEPQRTLVLRVSLSGPHYRAMPEQLEYLDELLRRVTGAPGVEAAGIANSPIRGTVTVEGAPPFQPGQAPQTIYSSASAAYARAVGMRLAKGRWIADTEPAEVAVINQAFARRVFGDDNPIGKRIRIPRQQPAPVATIVGVVADLKYSKLDADPEPQVYLPYRQSPFVRAMDVIVRVADNPSAVAPAVRKLISDIDRSQPAYNVQTLEQALADSIAPRRFNMVLLGVFAAVALALAAVGILGVMSYAVTQRTHEIGVRMALGARRSEVVGMVVRQGMLLAAMGIVAGYGAALGLTRLMAGLLYDVKPTDPWTFAAVGVMLCAAALVACSAPALRAARVDPVVALRYE